MTGVCSQAEQGTGTTGSRNHDRRGISTSARFPLQEIEEPADFRWVLYLLGIIKGLVSNQPNVGG